MHTFDQLESVSKTLVMDEFPAVAPHGNTKPCRRALFRALHKINSDEETIGLPAEKMVRH